MQTPNSDTPYSFLGLDLRAEPVVITVPAIEKSRYFSVQFIDCVHAQLRLRRQPCHGQRRRQLPRRGAELEMGRPKGVTKAIRSETELVLAAYRTQLFNPGDLDNVKKVQAGYKVQPLWAFLGQPAPAAAPAIEFIKPLTPETQKTSLEFFNILNFVLTVVSDRAVGNRADGALREDRCRGRARRSTSASSRPR